MNRRLIHVLLCLTMLTIVSASPALAREQRFAALQPGESLTYEQTIPINLVFVGYDEHQIDRQAIQDLLPATYEPVIRIPRFYGVTPRQVGLRYTFDYNFVDTPSQFEDRFFRHLRTSGQTGDLTAYQELYNQQQRNVLDIAGPVLYIDAPSTERWLETNSRAMLGLNTTRAYTVFFINWYNRPDFRFHVYTKTDQPDPDTGVNFGQVYESRKMIAWGGSRGRTWFYDLSAGPEAWTNNWNVDDPDLDGNGTPDYRMPPIWEYRQDGYREPSELSGDLGRITRFVAINLLFTSSPLYDPLASAPGPRGNRVVHIEMFNDDPDSRGEQFINTEMIRKELRRLQPYYDWQVHLEVNDELDHGVERAFRIFTGLIEPEADDCATDFGTPFAALFCYFDANLDTYVPSYGPNDYVGEVFAFNTTDQGMGDWFGLLGFADDNWIDGTPTYIFEFDTATLRQFGWGFTVTTIHEFGHHIGLSHPHDGYDFEQDLDYGPVDEFNYVWSGDEVGSLMSYIDLHWSFSQFDRDNLYRWEMAGYLNRANELLDDILAHPGSVRYPGLLRQAEAHASQALRSFENWNYLRAAANARYAYETLANIANALGIQPEPSDARMGLPRSDVPRQIDPIRPDRLIRPNEH